MSSIPAFRVTEVPAEAAGVPAKIIREIRAEAFREAADAVLATRMPARGDGPVLLLDVLTLAANRVRGMR